jgi:hypothetical protein
MVQALTDNHTAAEIEKGISDYSSIGALIDGGIPQQVRFDMQALQRAAGRNFTKREEEQFRAVQTQAQRWTYIGSAMTHPKIFANSRRNQSWCANANRRDVRIFPLNVIPTGFFAQ